MNKISQYFLVCIATIAVAFLAQHAYILATDTFSLPFIGQEQQTNSTVKIAFAKPWIQFGSNSPIDVIDTGAILSALRKNGKTWNPTISGEGYMMVSGEYMEIGSNTWKKDDTITISAKEYNAAKKTGWKLPRDIVSQYTEIAKKFNINPVGLPRDMAYQVQLSGYKDLTTSDIRWYLKTLNADGGGCDINTWNSNTWKQLTTKTPPGGSSNVMTKDTYILDMGKYPSGSCLIAGIAGDFQYITLGRLGDFVATGSVTDVLSPEYDMLSRIEFQFSTDIFADSGTLYSREYIEHRHLEKIEFLKKLSISSGLEITEDNLELTPNRASIYGNFLEGKEYTIDLDAIKDIYGRSASIHMSFIPKSVPLLSLQITGNKTILKYGDAISSKLFRSKSAKNEYDIKLCQISLEGYARAERMNELKNKIHTEALYSLLSSSEISNCHKKTISLMASGSVANFDANEFVPKGLNPGLYIMAFQNQSDIAGFNRWVAPKLFAIVDTNIVMKIDSSGKMQLLATDIKTGQPRENQDITIKNNISQLYKQEWNNTKMDYDTIYTPLGAISWGSGISLGKTQFDGTLSKNQVMIDGNNPYNFTSEWWNGFDGQYNSFVAVSRGSGHFGYVVSTWNDGITGWNFGMKESDYGWENRSLYSAYIHTDRRLYLPGETVNIKAIMRKNESTLTIPDNEIFDITINDSVGKTVSSARIKANSFGSIATQFIIPGAASLGVYSVYVQLVGSPEIWISNSYTTFQVEIFKNPTFTSEVKLSSPEVTAGILTNVREVSNNDMSQKWYQYAYQSEFNIEGIVKAHYYNGAIIKSVPFAYKIYKSPHYDTSYWSGCFWGCHYEPTPEFYTEGNGTIDADGFGVFRTPVAFSSFSDDYMYTAEVTITDPLTGEAVTTPGTLLVGIGTNNKLFDINNPLQATITKKMLKPGDNIEATINPKYGKWDPTLKGKYRYELTHREYTTAKISTLREQQAPITHSTDSVVRSGSIKDAILSLDTKSLKPGEYFLRLIPVTKANILPPPESLYETLIYLTGDFTSKDSILRVIPEKTIYQNGEMARVLITTPFSSGGHLYITRERGGVIDHEYVAYSGSTYTREYRIDDSFYPNVYIGAIAFPKGGLGDKGYAVGYSEIVMDMSDKKGILTIKTDKEIYKNRDMVTAEIVLLNKQNKGVAGEIEIMVIDESLIRLLGNIDLDIIPKFFAKYPFTMKTALTVIGIERNRFLSRKGANGGSGDKGGDGGQISSRTLFQNTAYYNPSILTDVNGKATIKFKLPDNVTDYRIIAIGQTKSSQFSVAEKTIAIRRDYTLETHAPTLVYIGDQTTITVSAFNATARITPVQLSIEVGTGGTLFKKTETLILNPSASLSQDFKLDIETNWEGKIPYTLTLRDKGTVLDSITKTLHIAKPPIVEAMIRVSGFTNTGITLAVPAPIKNTNPDSKVTISVSDSPLQNPEKMIASMISYPYGCIEQTISTTLPNAVALKLAKSLDIQIDLKQASTNLSIGVAKILKMQDASGGWKYWEDDTMVNNHVTPYVIRSLYELRSLGVNIPNEAIARGLEYMANTIISKGEISDMDMRAEWFATFAKAKHTKTLEVQKSIDVTSLTRHGYLMYQVGVSYLGKLSDADMKNLEIRMNSRTTQSYWYWDDAADQAIYARLLIRSGASKKAGTIISNLLKTVDLQSYYVSTQSKIQIFMALIDLSSANNSLSAFQIETGTLKLAVQPSEKMHRYSYETRRSLIGKTLTLSNIPRNSTLFYEVSLQDAPLDIFKMPPKQHPNLSVKRVFETVDESKGLDSNGQFKSAKIHTTGIFKKGTLYRVRITVTQKSEHTTKYYLTLEDHIPGGWRPINPVFKTESSSMSDSISSEYGYWNGWTHVEAREDKIFATQDYMWGTDQPYTYTYYIRPEYSGTYLLPPVMAYYMYQPEIHAIGAYEKITVQ